LRASDDDDQSFGAWQLCFHRVGALARALRATGMIRPTATATLPV
jgi:hypothetical protein